VWTRGDGCCPRGSQATPCPWGMSTVFRRRLPHRTDVSFSSSAKVSVSSPDGIADHRLAVRETMNQGLAPLLPRGTITRLCGASLPRYPANALITSASNDRCLLRTHGA
jgi:hypothetical protein